MCKFSFHPERWPGETEFDKIWECPYPSYLGEEFCLFHLHPERRQHLIPDRIALQEAFASLVDNVEYELELVCVCLDDIDISYISSGLPEAGAISIHASTINHLQISSNLECRIQFYDSYIQSFRADRAVFEYGARIERTEIDNLSASGSRFQQTSRFTNCTFGDTDFTRSTFEEAISFAGDLPESGSPVKEKSCTFENTANFSQAKFEDAAFFYGVSFEEGGVFLDAEFGFLGYFEDVDARRALVFRDVVAQGSFSFDNSEIDFLSLRGSEFHGAVSLCSTTLGSRPGFDLQRRQNQITLIEGGELPYPWLEEESEGVGLLSECVSDVGDVCLVLNSCTFEDEIQIQNGTFQQPITAWDMIVTGNLLMDVEIDANPALIMLNRSVLQGGEICIDEKPPKLELVQATLGPVSIISPEGTNPFSYMYFDRTKFDDFDFTAHRSSLDEINWKIAELDHTDMWAKSSRMEETYAKARRGAESIGDKRAVSEFFKREHRERRNQYATKVVENPSNRIANAGKFTTNWAYDILCEYGENPVRVLLWSAATIIAFASLLSTLGLNSDPTQSPIYTLGENLAFSTQAFSTLVVGTNFESLSLGIRLLTALEGLLGTLAAGLFIATMVRIVDR